MTPELMGEAVRLCKTTQAVIGWCAGNVSSFHGLIFSACIYAAWATNGWFRSRPAAFQIMQMQWFSCCARTQRENQIHRLGSAITFAAIGMNGRCRETAQTLQSPLPALSGHWASRMLRNSERQNGPHFSRAPEHGFRICRERLQTRLPRGNERPFHLGSPGTLSFATEQQRDPCGDLVCGLGQSVSGEMRVAVGAVRIGMPQKLACGVEAFAREDRVAGICMAQVMQAQSGGQLGAGLNPLPRAVDLRAGVTGMDR